MSTLVVLLHWLCLFYFYSVYATCLVFSGRLPIGHFRHHHSTGHMEISKIYKTYFWSSFHHFIFDSSLYYVSKSIWRNIYGFTRVRFNKIHSFDQIRSKKGKLINKCQFNVSHAEKRAMPIGMMNNIVRSTFHSIRIWAVLHLAWLSVYCIVNINKVTLIWPNQKYVEPFDINIWFNLIFVDIKTTLSPTLASNKRLVETLFSMMIVVQLTLVFFLLIYLLIHWIALPSIMVQYDTACVYRLIFWCNFL